MVGCRGVQARRVELLLLAHKLGLELGLHELALEPDAFVVFSLGDVTKDRFSDQGTASRMGAAATIRQSLVQARDYAARRGLPVADRPPVDLGMEALVELLEGERRALVHAHRLLADEVVYLEQNVLKRKIF